MENLSSREYQALAEFRYQIRRFLRFSERAAGAAGIEPQQHQLLLAVKGSDEEPGPTISYLAERMQLRHHSVVGLVDRLMARMLVVRIPNDRDKRQVHIRLTPQGEETLRRLSMHHANELRTAARALVASLHELLGEPGAEKEKERENAGGL